MEKKKMSKRKKLTIMQGILSCVCVILSIAIVITVGYLFKVRSAEKIDASQPQQSDVSTSDALTTQPTTVTTTQPTTVTTTQPTTAATTQSTTKATTAETTQQTTEATTVTDSKVTSTTSSSSRIIVYPSKVKYWNLIVVNSGREIPEGYIPKLEYVAGSDIRMDYRVAPHYDDMYYAAKKDGITLTPFSGYRTYERQKTNYNNLTNQYMSQYGLSREEAAKKAASVILPPGTSEHNLGLAMDVCNVYDSFANQPEYAWLVKNAYKYGFILRYTAEKQPITGIVPEPWHWRYVGVEYAEKIKNSGLCLEEYLDSVGIAY